MTKNQPEPSMPPPFYRLDPVLPILFVTLVFFLTFIARVMASPLMPRIESEMNLRHAQAGSLFLVMSIGYFIALTGSGFISSRLCHRRTIVLAVSGVGASLLFMAVSQTLWHLRISVFAMGLAAGIYLPSGITTLTSMVDPRNWGKAISIHELAPNLAFVAAPVIAEIFLLYDDWRAMPAVVGIVCLAAGMIFFVYGRGGDFPGKPPGAAAFRMLMANRGFWVMVLLFGLAISSTMGLYTMLPLYLVKEIDMPRSSANSLVAFSRLLGLFAALASGWASDRFGPRRTISVMLGLTGICTILMGIFTSPAAVAALVTTQAMLSTGFFPAGFAVLSGIGPAGHRNVAVSFAIPMAFVYGGGVAPTIIGMTGDAGSFATGIIFVGVLICCGTALPFCLANAPGQKG